MNKKLFYPAILVSFSLPVFADQTSPTLSHPAPNPPAPQINCQYKIPASQTQIDSSLVKTWVSKAIEQSFDFSPATIDTQLEALQDCFTKHGWEGFQSAFHASGNLEAIKQHHFTVSSQIDGSVTLSSTKENHWKAMIPLQVVYQNDKEKLTQLLNIDAVIGRKVSGELGLIQVIAVPRTKERHERLEATSHTP